MLEFEAAAWCAIKDAVLQADGCRNNVTETVRREWLIDSVLLYEHRNHEGRGAQDGHIDYHTAPEL